MKDKGIRQNVLQGKQKQEIKENFNNQTGKPQNKNIAANLMSFYQISQREIGGMLLEFTNLKRMYPYSVILSFTFYLLLSLETNLDIEKKEKQYPQRN